MSSTVFWIAAAHSIPVFLGRMFAGKKGALAMAFFACLVAGFLGSVRYAIFDFIAIGIALLVCIKINEIK